MAKIFVIAGNHHQFAKWRMEKLNDPAWMDKNDIFRTADIVSVENVRSLIGISDPHGVFIGTWRERDDILEILDELAIRVHQNSKIIQLKSQIWQTATNQQRVHQASKALAAEIDKEVLKQLMIGNIPT